MNTRQFLSIVWPAKGPYCIATPWVKPDGQTVMAHRGCETIDDAISYIAVNKQSKDLYFAPHALKVRRELNPATGKMQTFRVHENMREARDFFFDIDSKEGKPKAFYATRVDALNALEQFLFKTCLPSPFVIDSGYGIHVHWVIETTLESVAWTEPAARLYWLAQQHGLHVDSMRTTDQSSVLRIPNTFNLKDRANPRKVEILAEGVVTDDFLTQLNDLTGEYDRTTDSGPKSSTSTSGLNVAWDGRHPPADEVADVCEHMKTFRDSQGNVPEPAWHVGIGTIKHCDDGEEKAHEWSSGYPGYTKTETQAKLDAWTLPPPGCEKIDKNSGSPSICARCPYKDLAKNPIMIANKVYEHKHQQQPPPGPAPASIAGVPIPPCQPPRPYILDMTFGIRTKKEGIICTYPMFPVQLVKATANEDALSRWYVKPPRGDWQLVSIRNKDLEPREFAAALRNKDIIIVNQKHVKQVQTFMRAYMHELQKQQDSFEQFDFVGYNVKREEGKPVEFEDYTHFIMYDRKISIVDGSITPCIMTKNTKIDGMGQRGTLAQQIALMDFYNKPQYMAHQFAIACSLATPFFVHTGQHGVLICLVGETGVSKSTAAFTAASLWGHPKRYCLSGLETNFTEKARQERESMLRNQPFIVDELTLLPDASVSQIALAASQLGSRGSLTSSREFRPERGGYKANLTIATSNVSLVQKINATNPGGLASLMRIFEIKIAENDARAKIDADRFMRQLVKNYGWIGEDCLRKCLPQAEELAEKFLGIMYKLEATIKSRSAERFITAAAAIALLGIKLGNKLGYFNYSYKAMWNWLVDEQIPAIRNAVERERKTMAPETILHEYLETIGPSICRVTRNQRGEVEVIYTPLNSECKARYEIAKGEIYARIQPFKDYCNERHHDHNNILDQLYTNGLVISKSERKRMHAEPNTMNHPTTCFVIALKPASPIAVPTMPESRKIVELSKFKKPER